MRVGQPIVIAAVLAVWATAVPAHPVPEERLTPEAAVTGLPGWSKAGLWPYEYDDGALRVYSVAPIEPDELWTYWRNARQAAGRLFGVMQFYLLPPPTIVLTTREHFDAHAAELGMAPPPPGFVRAGLYDRNLGQIWTWQRPIRVRAGQLGGRETIFHEMLHHILWVLDDRHLGEFHDRVGQLLNEALP